jgi:hypothetical protein
MANDPEKLVTQEKWAEWNKGYTLPILTPEQTIEWLEGMREFNTEVWKKNPYCRPQWVKDLMAEAGERGWNFEGWVQE